MLSVESPCLEGRTVAHLGKVRVKHINERSGVEHSPLTLSVTSIAAGFGQRRLSCAVVRDPLTLPRTRVFMWKM